MNPQCAYKRANNQCSALFSHDPYNHSHIEGHSPNSNTLITDPNLSNAIKTLPYVSCSSPIPLATLAQPLISFQRLEIDLRKLVTILVYLGVADISEGLLFRACKPRLSWDHCGEIESTLLDLVPMLVDVDKFKSALNFLKSVVLITSKAEPLGQQSFSIDASVQLHIEKFASSPTLWKIQASKLVFHTFSLDQKIEPI